MRFNVKITTDDRISSTFDYRLELRIKSAKGHHSDSSLSTTITGSIHKQGYVLIVFDNLLNNNEQNCHKM